MTEPPIDKETVLVDVSGLPLDDLLTSTDNPLMESIRRLSAETDSEAIAGFNQGIS